MEALKQKIMALGTVINDEVIDLNAILNHQIDPPLIMAMGRELALRYAGTRISKVLTVEASGISLGMAAALELQVPMLFARRNLWHPGDDDVYSERVPSFTKGKMTDLVIARSFLSKDDSILIIDDIISNGAVAQGLIQIIRRAGASLTGVGVAVEKTFQPGGKSLREQGIRVEALVQIETLANREIRFGTP